MYSVYGDGEKITLTGEDGTVYNAMRGVGNSYPLLNTVVYEQFDLYFEGLTAGKYTLNIPYLFLIREWTSEEVVLQLPKEENQRIDCDITSLFPDGAGIHITGITKQEAVGDSFVDDPATGKPVSIKVYYWEYVLETEIITAGEAENSGKPVFFMAAPATDGSVPVGLSISSTDNIITLQTDKDVEVDEITLWFREPEYILDKSFTLDITIQEEAE